ncbi:MAG: hypothetical protein RIR25_297 [Verrucomicrobiota bacterium]|jgi:hypothetical protein
MDQNDRQLWDLLGLAARPSAPPFFAAKVMRRIEAGARPSLLPAIMRWLAPATIAALVVLAILPRPETASDYALADEALTSLDLVELVNPDDYELLTSAGWPYDNGILSTEL